MLFAQAMAGAQAEVSILRAFTLSRVFFIIHGTNASSPEEAMRNMGRIASPGMTATEKTIVDIQAEKRPSKGE